MAAWALRLPLVFAALTGRSGPALPARVRCAHRPLGPGAQPLGWPGAPTTESAQPSLGGDAGGGGSAPSLVDHGWESREAADSAALVDPSAVLAGASP